MKKRISIAVGMFAILIIAGLSSTAFGQGDKDFATVSGGGSSIRFDSNAAGAGIKLTITAPDGRWFSKEFKAGVSPEFTFNEKLGLPDGVYTYELKLQPALTAAQKEEMKRSRGKDDDSENERGARRPMTVPAMVQQGSFALLNGQVIVAGLSESERSAKLGTPSNNTPAANTTSGARISSGNTVSRLRNHRMSLVAPLFDFVINDDLIVIGSACVGLDCVDGESFSFDTIRLKENNTRISFNDTSVGAFPTNDWTIRANSSASGGQSFLAFVDKGANNTGAETGTIIFEVDAGAPSNSLRVSSSGNVGLGTGTPVLDLHINTTDTPAMRLEQNNGGGFTAQTWDIGANEANFFVRDVTGGSRLSFRIRPGAPTSSIDISADGDVGVGTASPDLRLDVETSVVNDGAVIHNISNTTGGSVPLFLSVTNATSNVSNTSIESISFAGATAADMILRTGALTGTGFGTERMRILGSNGRVGIGTAAPDQLFSVNGDASKTGGATWQAFSDVRLKNIKGNFTSGLSAVMQLQPLRYRYKDDNSLGLKSERDQIGFSAQDLQKVLPEAVTKTESGYLMVNSDPILWTMLNAIKEQQKEIEQLKGEIQKLRKATHRRRK